jgi:hypothetical protein
MWFDSVTYIRHVIGVCADCLTRRRVYCRGKLALYVGKVTRGYWESKSLSDILDVEGQENSTLYRDGNGQYE